MNVRSLSHTLSGEVLDKLREVAEREGISELAIVEFALSLVLDSDPSPTRTAKLQTEQARLDAGKHET